MKAQLLKIETKIESLEITLNFQIENSCKHIIFKFDDLDERNDFLNCLNISKSLTQVTQDFNCFVALFAAFNKNIVCDNDIYFN